MSTSTEINSNFKIRIIIGLKLKSINNNMLLIPINFQMMAQQIEHWPSFILLQHYKIWFYKRLVWYFVLSSFLFLSLCWSQRSIYYIALFLIDADLMKFMIYFFEAIVYIFQLLYNYVNFCHSSHLKVNYPSPNCSII